MTRPAGFVLLLLAIASTSAVVSLTASDAQKATYHHGLEGVVYNDLLGGLPDTVNSLFQGSGKCESANAACRNETVCSRAFHRAHTTKCCAYCLSQIVCLRH